MGSNIGALFPVHYVCYILADERGDLKINSQYSKTLLMAFQGLQVTFEDDFSETCAKKLPLWSMV
jgi:hypothetical protein